MSIPPKLRPSRSEGGRHTFSSPSIRYMRAECNPAEILTTYAENGIIGKVVFSPHAQEFLFMSMKKRSKWLPIDELRTFVHERLPAQGEKIDIPVGMVFGLSAVIAVQKELQVNGYEAHTKGKGNGTTLSIRHPHKKAQPRMAFA